MLNVNTVIEELESIEEDDDILKLWHIRLHASWVIENPDEDSQRVEELKAILNRNLPDEKYSKMFSALDRAYSDGWKDGQWNCPPTVLL